MNRKDIDKLIRDYLSGKPSPEGEKLFNAWYASHDDESSPLDAVSETEKEKIRLEIFEKVRAVHPAQPQKARKLPESLGWKSSQRWYGIAAVWIGLMMIPLAYFVYKAQQPEWVTYQTAYGEVENIILPDGSNVTLNANSQIRYAATWEENTHREVWLDGEAYFSVVHTANDQKFLVQTTDLNVEVLGTEFNVNNRRGDTEVVLHTGKVKLDLTYNKETPEVVMQPGELVAYSAANQQITKKIVDPDQYSSWRKQELMLNNTSLTQIARVLEDYYGFEVNIPDDLKDIKLSATAQLSLKDKDVILTAIAEIYGIKVEKNGNQIIFNNP
jgi:ferric-dicitrate binding protein FerR (iron transport regulator)